MSSVIPAKAFIIGRLVAQPMARLGLQTSIEFFFVEMLRDVSVEFLQWGCASVYRWRPEPISGVPLFAIHGAEDRILPHKRRSVDVTLDGAGRLLTLTHAERVNEFPARSEDSGGRGSERLGHEGDLFHIGGHRGLLGVCGLYSSMYFGWLLATPLTDAQLSRVKFDRNAWFVIFAAASVVSIQLALLAIESSRKPE